MYINICFNIWTLFLEKQSKFYTHTQHEAYFLYSPFKALLILLTFSIGNDYPVVVRVDDRMLIHYY